MRESFILFTCLFVALSFTNGCGYRYPYPEPEAGQPWPVKVHLKIWENETNELGLESFIRKSLSDWLIQSKQLTLVSSPNTADYIIDGRIYAVDYPGSSYDSYGQATVLKSIITYGISILQTGTGEKTYEVFKTTKESAYAVGKESAVLSQSNKRVSFSGIADLISEETYMEIFYILTKETHIK